MWLTFLVPAGYVLWMLMFRMNKEQKAWLAAHEPGQEADEQLPPSGSGKCSLGAANNQLRLAAPKKAKSEPVSSSGRALPQNSGRYTRPQNRATDQKSRS